MQNKQFVFVALMIAMIAMTPMQVSPVLAYESEEDILEPISGSDVDPTTFEYDGHLVADGFAAGVSMDLPVPIKHNTMTRACWAVGLGDTWEESGIAYHIEYTPYVKEMWLQIQGDPNYEVTTRVIFDNTGTGEPSWEALLKLLVWIGDIFTLYEIVNFLAKLYQEPPCQEWQYGDHWARPIVRQKTEPGYIPLIPYVNPDNPRLRTAGAKVLSYFDVDGINTLTITANASIYLQKDNKVTQGIVHEHIGTYELNFEVEVPVGVYDLSVRTYQTNLDPIYDVKVWIDDVYVGDSWVYGYDVGYGTHTVEVESLFNKLNYKYTFQYWEYGYTSNPRTVDVFSDTILRAYYDFEVNHRPNKPSTPSGPSNGYTYTTYTYYTYTTDPDEDDVRYKFDWGDGTTTTTGFYGSGNLISRSHSWSSAGTYYVKVRAQDGDRGLWSYWSSSLEVSISPKGGGCPILSVYDGSEYVEEGSLNIHSAEDTVVCHELTVTPAKVKHKYYLRLTEPDLPESHSYIDQVKLLAVDGSGETIRCPLIGAEHSEDGNVLYELLLSDDVRTDTEPYEYIDLTFLAPTGEIDHFTFVIEGYNIKTPFP